ncbi:MAG: hypothetical protein EBR82_12215 [Caulobacteraceae bacterium]|nr:hypothetical protein [Caulobacteraceae bacterium]
MANLDTTALSAVLKQKYTQKAVRNLCYPKNPFFAMVQKRTDFNGKNKVVAFQNGSPQGLGTSIANAQAGKTASVYNAVTVTRNAYYVTASITGEAIRAAKGDTGALIEGLTREVDNAYYSIVRQISAALFRNGGGAIGQISSGSTVGSTTITLANVADVVNFEVGMKLSASVDDGTGGGGLRSSGAVVTITGIDRDLGTLTASGNWSTGIAAVAAGDYLFRNSNAGSGTSDYNAVLKGVPAWIPATAPGGSDSFFGLNRSSDATRLAGIRYNGNGGPIEETLIEAAARAVRESGQPTHVWMNPLDCSNLVKALGSKVLYDRSKSLDDPDFAFSSIKLIGPAGDLEIVRDLNVPKGTAFMTQTDVWFLESAGDMPSILDDDGLTIVRSATSDDYEVRIGYYGQLVCEAPGWNVNITL